MNQWAVDCRLLFMNHLNGFIENIWLRRMICPQTERLHSLCNVLASQTIQQRASNSSAQHGH